MVLDTAGFPIVRMHDEEREAEQSAEEGVAK